MQNEKWVLCPVCGNKTRIKIRENTVLLNFPLFCPKCRQEQLINVQQLKVTIIRSKERIASISSCFFALAASLLTCAIKRICVPNIRFALSETMTLYFLSDIGLYLCDYVVKVSIEFIKSAAVSSCYSVFFDSKQFFS